MKLISVVQPRHDLQWVGVMRRCRLMLTPERRFLLRFLDQKSHALDSIKINLMDYTKWNKADREKQIAYDFTYI